MDISGRVKELRNVLGITQQQLAYDTGLSVDGIRSIESGRAKPNIETLSKLADRFGCSTDYLLGKEKPVGLSQKEKDVIRSIATMMSEEELEELFKILQKIRSGEI